MNFFEYLINLTYLEALGEYQSITYEISTIDSPNPGNVPNFAVGLDYFSGNNNGGAGSGSDSDPGYGSGNDSYYGGGDSDPGYFSGSDQLNFGNPQPVQSDSDSESDTPVASGSGLGSGRGTEDVPAETTEKEELPEEEPSKEENKFLGSKRSHDDDVQERPSKSPRI